MGNRRRTAAALAALTMVAGLACAANAQALGLNLNIGPIQIGVNVSAPYIEGVLTGQNQPLDTVGNLLCTTGQKVGGNLPGGQPVSQALCAIPALDYQYVTRFKNPDGSEIVRRHTALVNIPTPLNVDGDLLPDVTATVQVFSLTQFTLKIDRMLLELAPLPVKIEAIVDDPTAGGAAAREHQRRLRRARQPRAEHVAGHGDAARRRQRRADDAEHRQGRHRRRDDDHHRRRPLRRRLAGPQGPDGRRDHLHAGADAGDARPHAGLLHGGARGRQPAGRRQGPRRDRRRPARAARELQPRRAAAEPARAPRGAGYEPAHRHVRGIGERAVARRDVQRRHERHAGDEGRREGERPADRHGAAPDRRARRDVRRDRRHARQRRGRLRQRRAAPALERHPSVRPHLRRRRAEVLRGPDRRAAVGLGRRDDEDRRRAAARARAAQAAARARRHARTAHRRAARGPAAPPEGALRRRRRRHRLQRLRRDDRRHHARRRADDAVLRPRHAHPRPHQRAAVAGDGEHQAQRGRLQARRQQPDRVGRGAADERAGREPAGGPARRAGRGPGRPLHGVRARAGPAARRRDDRSRRRRRRPRRARQHAAARALPAHRPDDRRVAVADPERHDRELRPGRRQARLRRERRHRLDRRDRRSPTRRCSGASSASSRASRGCPAS